MSRLKLSDIPLDIDALKRYELEMSPQGQVTRLKADTPEEHTRLMEALSAVRQLGGHKREPEKSASELTLEGIYNLFLTYEKTDVEPSTVRSYSGTNYDASKPRSIHCRLMLR